MKDIYYFSCLPPDFSFFVYWTLNRLDLPPEAFTEFCWETIYLISHPSRFSSFAKVQCQHFSSSKVRCSTFLRHLLGSFFAFYFVVLKNFKIDFFQLVFCNAVAIGFGIFQFTQAQVNVFVLTAFEYSYLQLLLVQLLLLSFALCFVMR